MKKCQLYSEIKPCLILVEAIEGHKRKPVSAGNSSKPVKVPTGSLVESCCKEIEVATAKGLTAQRISQDLRDSLKESL